MIRFCASYARDVYMLSDGQNLCQISRGADRKEFYDQVSDVRRLPWEVFLYRNDKAGHLEF